VSTDRSRSHTLSSDPGADAELAADLDALVPEWLTVPDVAERLGVAVTRVRQLLRDGDLVAIPRGDRRVLQVPAAFLAGDQVVKGLGGTLTVLHDAGYQPGEAVRWLFRPEDGLGAPPIEALASGHGTQVRRLAQALGF
jgi:Rv2175c C-terminal domain of unknown function